jgi:hypothetical protein
MSMVVKNKLSNLKDIVEIILDNSNLTTGTSVSFKANVQPSNLVLF